MAWRSMVWQSHARLAATEFFARRMESSAGSWGVQRFRSAGIRKSFVQGMNRQVQATRLTDSQLKKCNSPVHIPHRTTYTGPREADKFPSMATIQQFQQQVNARHLCGIPSPGHPQRSTDTGTRNRCPSTKLEGQWRQWGWVSLLKTPDAVTDSSRQGSHTARTWLDKPLFHAAFKAVGEEDLHAP